MFYPVARDLVPRTHTPARLAARPLLLLFAGPSLEGTDVADLEASAMEAPPVA